MNPAAKLLWASFGVLMAAGLLFWLTSCGGALPPAKRAEVVSCLDLANAALEQATTCEEARVALAKALRNAPMCVQLFGAQINMSGDGGAPVPCEQL